MQSLRSEPGFDPSTLLAAACLFAGLGLGITGLSVLAESAAGPAAGVPVAGTPLWALFGLVPTLAGAALTTTGGWLVGRLDRP